MVWWLKYDTVKLLEENIGKAFSDINCIHVFLGQSPKAMGIKAKVSKWDLIKHISFSTGKEAININIFSYGLGENICKWCDQQGLHFQNIQRTHQNNNNGGEQSDTLNAKRIDMLMIPKCISSFLTSSQSIRLPTYPLYWMSRRHLNFNWSTCKRNLVPMLYSGKKLNNKTRKKK